MRLYTFAPELLSSVMTPLSGRRNHPSGETGNIGQITLKKARMLAFCPALAHILPMIRSNPDTPDFQFDDEGLPPPSTPAPDPAEAEPNEHGGRKGPEPTRFGDWEKGGRCTDF
ncbi:DUF1674 domain-containing protein [Alphaproteobacteria bacterium LSUCC0684]